MGMTGSEGEMELGEGHGDIEQRPKGCTEPPMLWAHREGISGRSTCSAKALRWDGEWTAGEIYRG